MSASRFRRESDRRPESNAGSGRRAPAARRYERPDPNGGFAEYRRWRVVRSGRQRDVPRASRGRSRALRPVAAGAHGRRHRSRVPPGRERLGRTRRSAWHRRRRWSGNAVAARRRCLRAVVGPARSARRDAVLAGRGLRATQLTRRPGAPWRGPAAAAFVDRATDPARTHGSGFRADLSRLPRTDPADRSEATRVRPVQVVPRTAVAASLSALWCAAARDRQDAR